jgi:hypothetical protein
MQFLTHISLFESVGRAQTSCIRRRAHSKCVVQDCQTDTSTTCHATTPCCSWNSSSTQAACRIGLCPSLMTNRSSYIPTTRDPTSVSVSLCGTIYSQQQLPLPLTHGPPWLLNHVTTRSGSSTDGHQNIINPVELIGSLTARWTYRDLVHGRRVLLFQDNSTVFTSAITGYSDSDIVREIAGLFHLSVTALNVSLWIEHVKTEAMLADIPSRNSGFGHQHEASFRLLATSQRPISFPPQELWHDSVGMFEFLRRGA